MSAEAPAGIPTRLESERLILRPFVHSDWPALHAHYADPECTRFTFGRALSEGESWRALASMAGHWVLRGYGPYALEHKVTGAVIGATGLWYPNDWPEPEIKWALSRAFWGQGLASEAVRAVQAMALRAAPKLPLISFINAQNQASIRLALAVGARLELEREFRGSAWQLYRHPGYAAQTVSLKALDPHCADAQALLAASDRLMAALYPALASEHLASAAALSQPEVLFLGVWVGSELAGCGAVKRVPPLAGEAAYGEIKRVFVSPERRGHGLSKLLMQRLEQDLIDRGIGLARLETGIRQPEALALYARLGYRRCGPVGSNLADETGVFMQKQLKPKL
ncbi:GNAT family N-acetyltransferase [Paucibacter sp. B2R-40]|uniref:GNAT family N-acetyltransferase n=1 Tax=Paucibacter sp. B2R-40 TaxID=2893554 RepID=UPI0021E3BB3E|nr:GNAT family N-acetyltransferase [Paucibacter sp. B2R-40]MCV2352849.1 GNAT family N-acetyltransferase [Paucibacter sp. B2R-40]